MKNKKKASRPNLQSVEEAQGGNASPFACMVRLHALRYASVAGNLLSLIRPALCWWCMLDHVTMALPGNQVSLHNGCL